MLESSIPLLVILFLALFGSNYSVFIAALNLLLIKWLGFEAWLAPVETHGISVGITILTMAILVPIAQGKLTTQMLLDAFKSPVGLVAIAVGIWVSYLAAQGVPFMRETPEAVSALIVGTIAGVCLFHGLAVGPLIAGGLVSLVISLAGFFKA